MKNRDHKDVWNEAYYEAYERLTEEEGVDPKVAERLAEEEAQAAVEDYLDPDNYRRDQDDALDR